jgi:hypothetical protein
MTKQPLTKERALQIVKELYPDIDYHNDEDETEGLHQLYFLNEKYKEAIEYNCYIANSRHTDLWINEQGYISIGIININFDKFAAITGDEYIIGEERWVLRISIGDTNYDYDKEVIIDLNNLDEDTLRNILDEYKIVSYNQWQGIWRQKQIDSVIND